MPQKTNGLTSKEVQSKLLKFGPNVLPEKPPPSSFSLFLSQIKSPLVYVLLAAFIVTFILKDYSDALIILFAVCINTVLGFIQEKRAGTALFALRKMVTNEAEVLRDGALKKIDSSELVPLDIVQIRQGDKIPADGIVISANRFFVDEAALTGESVPVEKKDQEVIFMGTIASSGSALMRVKQTGSKTQMGEIAKEVQDVREDTPLTRRLAQFSQSLVITILFLTSFVFIIGIISKRPVLEMFSTAVALSVSAIPEGLLVGLTVVLAIGMQRIVSRKGLVRRLASAETLGSVTTICLDKTGTLTEGKMSVSEALGDTEAMALQMIVANDMDDAIVIAGYEWANNQLKVQNDKSSLLLRSKFKTGKALKQYMRIDSLPFSSEERFFASLNKWNEKEHKLFVTGAPEFLLGWSELAASEKKKIKATIHELSSSGKRIIALASKTMPFKTQKISSGIVKNGLTWHGILACTDPVRMGVKESLLKAQKAGIHLIVITGDYTQTARSIMEVLGIHVSVNEVITGEEIKSMSASQLSKVLPSIKLFARITPQQKLKIIEALTRDGSIVAMMGDGVNDAPALTKADIGIVVGDATDVARESADLVLLDSRFETVIAAIEEGRNMYKNVQKMILYLMSTAFNEIITVFGALALGFPLPLSAAQILWINVVSDSLPNMSLTVEPKSAKIMAELPQAAGLKLLDSKMKILIGIVSVISGLSALFLFIYVYTTTNDATLARSVCFILLGLNSLVYIFSIRTLLAPFWEESVFSNPWLLLSVSVGAVLQLLPFLVPALRSFFGLVIPSVPYWYLIAFVIGLVFVSIEMTKFVLRKS